MTSDADTRWAADRTERGQSFGAVAADYAAWRPGYPPELVAFLAGGENGHAEGRRILDLGAGTGRLTAELASAARRVVAVELDPQLAAPSQGCPGPRLVRDLQCEIELGIDTLHDRPVS